MQAEKNLPLLIKEGRKESPPTPLCQGGEEETPLPYLEAALVLCHS